MEKTKYVPWTGSIAVTDVENEQVHIEDLEENLKKQKIIWIRIKNEE